MIGLQSNNGIGKILAAQAGMAMVGSNGLPVFSTPKQITSSLRTVATTICLGLRRPAFLQACGVVGEVARDDAFQPFSALMQALPHHRPMS
jgi:hypothetical protein